MAFKQPRVPVYREGEGTARFLRTLTLFLKDFCEEAWVANRQREREIRTLQETVSGTGGAARKTAADAEKAEANSRQATLRAY